ncbi:hypothetical protein LINPERPRIM_LOCUS31723 [Linum perenne]
MGEQSEKEREGARESRFDGGRCYGIVIQRRSSRRLAPKKRREGANVGYGWLEQVLEPLKRGFRSVLKREGSTGKFEVCGKIRVGFQSRKLQLQEVGSGAATVAARRCPPPSSEKKKDETATVRRFGDPSAVSEMRTWVTFVYFLKFWTSSLNWKS